MPSCLSCLSRVPRQFRTQALEVVARDLGSQRPADGPPPHREVEALHRVLAAEPRPAPAAAADLDPRCATMAADELMGVGRASAPDARALWATRRRPPLLAADLPAALLLAIRRQRARPTRRRRARPTRWRST